ncbi:hypothetical protein SpCBS45565_g01540 [Spizellomyces sp. 'palustris']|nr:hypothetical protein SpCBS45565_g01540 [Spizellomyces sp. 'palustris']
MPETEDPPPHNFEQDPYDPPPPYEEPSTHPIVDALRIQLASLGLDTRGRKRELQKRLRSARKKVECTSSEDSGWSVPIEHLDTTSPKEDLDAWLDEKRPDGAQPYDYYCVLDVEATCDADSNWDYPNEIIEFPVVVIDGRRLEVVGEFQEFVRPLVFPNVTAFCTELTGITQSTVDAADPFPTVLSKFEQWLTQYTRYPFSNTLFISDGPWDIRDFIRKQCAHSIMERPPYLQRFVDLRRLYTDFYGRERQNLNGMLQGLGMTFEGRPHCGMDDARNIARIVVRMMKDGCVFVWNREVGASRRGRNKSSR